MKSREAVWGDMDMWSAPFRKMQPSVSRIFLNNVENYSLRMLNTALRGCRRRAAELEYGWPQFSVEAAVPAADIVTQQQATRLPLQDYPPSRFAA